MTDRFVTRGFVGRRTPPGAQGDVRSRIPPGQYLTTDFPVLSAGPTPRTQLDRWSFSIEGLVGAPVTWTWEEFMALPARDWTVDISCVTKWTKLDTRWRGVSVDTLLENVELDPRRPSSSPTPMAATRPTCPSRICSTGRPSSPTSTTARRSRRNTAARPDSSCLPATSGRAPSGSAASGSRPATSRASGNRSATTTGRPLARRALQRRLGAADGHLDRLAAGTVAAIRDETPTVRSFTLDVPGWPGHRAGQHVDLRLTAEDGYSVERSYSIASGRERDGEIELTVERIPDGEVSPFLHDIGRGRATGSSCVGRSAGISSGNPRSAARSCWSPAGRASSRSWR